MSKDVRGSARRVHALARRYPPGLVERQIADVRRTLFHLRLVQERHPIGATVCDIGGGVGLFSLACAANGLRAILVDDLGDSVNREYGDGALELHHELGVEVRQRDVLADGTGLLAGSVDAITTFESMEHWHHSPKILFREAVEALRRGGTFIIGVPNAVNLRKRVSVPLGRGKWSSMDDWYEAPVFRGHVREPDIDDLRYIANDLGLVEIAILGRNWMAYRSPRRISRALIPFIDRPLWRFPALCADIYLVGRKP